MHMDSKGTKTVNKGVPHGAFCPFCSAINITRLVLLMELLPHCFVRGPGRGRHRMHDWHRTLNWYYVVNKGHPV